MRKWENIISYEDRSAHLTTSRWRLAGVKTKEGAQNTDDGILWLVTTKSGDTVTAELYKDDGCGSANKVASGTADVSGCDKTGANAVEVTLSAAESSGLSGSLWIHDYEGDGTCSVQVALCVDEDLDGLWDDIENLPGYDATNGLAEFIRIAGEDVIGKVAAIFQEKLGGHGSTEAWYITDADRAYPDLRCIANPGQLRSACAYHALEIALGRSHQRAGDTMYSRLRDYNREQYESAMAALTLTVKSGGGDDASDRGSSQVVRWERT